MDQLLKARLNQQIEFASYVEQTGAGVPVYATTTTIYGYIAGRTAYRESRGGERVYSEQTVYVNETYAALLKKKDKLTLPNGQTFIIQDTQVFYKAEGGIDFGGVYL